MASYWEGVFQYSFQVVSLHVFFKKVGSFIAFEFEKENALQDNFPMALTGLRFLMFGFRI